MKNKKYILLSTLLAYHLVFGAARMVPEDPASSNSVSVAGATDSSTPGLLEEKKEKAAARETFNDAATQNMWFALLTRTPHNFAKNLKELKDALENGADLNARYREGQQTPLIKLINSSIFSEDEKMEMAQVLISHGANLLLADKYGYLPLHVAIDKQYVKVVQLLLSQDAEKQVNVLSYGRDYSPLMHLVSMLVEDNFVPPLTIDQLNVRRQKAEAIADLLIHNGADPFIKNKTGEDVIIYALQIIDSLRGINYKTALQAFMKHLTNTIAQREKQLNRALNQVPEMRALPAQLTDIISSYAISENQPAANTNFNAAATAQMWDTLQLWTPQRSDPSFVEKELKSALERRANPNSRNREGHTPLLNVLSSSYFLDDQKSALISLLLNHGANPLLPNAQGNLPIHQAITRATVELLQSLLSKNPEDQVNALNPEGNTPLAVMIERVKDVPKYYPAEVIAHFPAVADLLIEKGADLSLTNKSGDDPLDQSIKFMQNQALGTRKRELLQLLVDHLANIKSAQLKEAINKSSVAKILPPDLTNIISSYLAPERLSAPSVAASVELEEQE